MNNEGVTSHAVESANHLAAKMEDNNKGDCTRHANRFPKERSIVQQNKQTHAPPNEDLRHTTLKRPLYTEDSRDL